MTTLSVDTGTPPAPVAEQPPEAPWIDELTPRQIVAELDKYIIGQEDAKRAVAIALRNRWRRQRLPAALRDEIDTINQTVYDHVNNGVYRCGFASSQAAYDEAFEPFKAGALIVAALLMGVSLARTRLRSGCSA